MRFVREQNRIDRPIDFRILKEYAKTNLSEIIYDNLKGKILKCDFKSSERLQEDNLARDYQSSRTPIRDALRKLNQENIIEKLPYGGYRIIELTLKEIEEIFGIRAVLEGYAALLATQRVSETEIKQMEKILKNSQQAIKNNDYGEFVELNTEFHDCLYNASRSEHLLRILRNLRDYFYRYQK
jgi:DNA-binding GntR family transcriptional regulator